MLRKVAHSNMCVKLFEFGDVVGTLTFFYLFTHEEGDTSEEIITLKSKKGPNTKQKH